MFPFAICYSSIHDRDDTELEMLLCISGTVRLFAYHFSSGVLGHLKLANLEIVPESGIRNFQFEVISSGLIS